MELHPRERVFFARHEDAENALFTWSRAMRDKPSQTLTGS